MNDEKGFGCHVEATVFQELVVTKGEIAPFMLWVHGSADVKRHRGFDGSRYSGGFMMFIWGERTGKYLWWLGN